jgi:hypothetical protein
MWKHYIHILISILLWFWVRRYIMTYLTPISQQKTITGKLAYNESVRAWNIIRLKKDILDYYTQLRQKSKTFSYEMQVSHHYDIIESIIKKAKKEGKAPPLMLWLKIEEELL